MKSTSIRKTSALLCIVPSSTVESPERARVKTVGAPTPGTRTHKRARNSRNLSTSLSAKAPPSYPKNSARAVETSHKSSRTPSWPKSTKTNGAPATLIYTSSTNCSHTASESLATSMSALNSAEPTGEPYYTRNPGRRTVSTDAYKCSREHASTDRGRARYAATDHTAVLTRLAASSENHPGSAIEKSSRSYNTSCLCTVAMNSRVLERAEAAYRVGIAPSYL